MEWIIQLVLGAIGGQLLNAIMGTGAEGNVVADIAGGGIGGIIIIMAIVGWIKNTLAKK